MQKINTAPESTMFLQNLQIHLHICIFQIQTTFYELCKLSSLLRIKFQFLFGDLHYSVSYLTYTTFSFQQ